MRITDLLLKKFHNKELVLVDSENFVYEIIDVDMGNGKIVLRIKDIILTNHESNLDSGVEDVACNSEWNKTTPPLTKLLDS